MHEWRAWKVRATGGTLFASLSLLLEPSAFAFSLDTTTRARLCAKSGRLSGPDLIGSGGGAGEAISLARLRVAAFYFGCQIAVALASALFSKLSSQGRAQKPTGSMIGPMRCKRQASARAPAKSSPAMQMTAFRAAHAHLARAMWRKTFFSSLALSFFILWRACSSSVRLLDTLGRENERPGGELNGWSRRVSPDLRKERGVITRAEHPAEAR